MELKESLYTFVQTFGREGIDLGELNINLEEAEDNNSLESFYKLLQFEEALLTGGELSIGITPLKNQAKDQEGWAWTRKDNKKIRDEKSWSADWTVFANKNGDAIYFNQADGKVYGSIEKQQHYELANSLATFFEVLSACMLLEEKKYHFNTSDEDKEVLPEFIEDVQATISGKLEEEQMEDFVTFFFY